MRKKVRKRAGKRLLRAGFDRLWKTPWKTWKTPGFAHCTQIFHKRFPESFPVWKTDVADLCDNVPSRAGLTGSSDHFNRLSRVFRPFCYRFSGKAAGKRAANPIYRAGKRDIFGFPQSQHPLLRLLRPYLSILSFSFSPTQPKESARRTVSHDTPPSHIKIFHPLKKTSKSPP